MRADNAYLIRKHMSLRSDCSCSKGTSSKGPPFIRQGGIFWKISPFLATRFLATLVTSLPKTMVFSRFLGPSRAPPGRSRGGQIPCFPNRKQWFLKASGAVARARSGQKQCFPNRKQWFLKVSGAVARAPDEEPGRAKTMFSESKGKGQQGKARKARESKER